MSAESLPLAGAAGTLRTLVDGSVRLSIDFEPKDRAAVMAAFGAPGTPVAVVRLRDGFEAKDDGKQRTTSGYRDLGPICREAIDLCGNAKFREWVARPGIGVRFECSDQGAKDYILKCCNVDSRKELDTAEGARELFIQHVRKPFHHWLTETSK